MQGGAAVGATGGTSGAPGVGGNSGATSSGGAVSTGGGGGDGIGGASGSGGTSAASGGSAPDAGSAGSSSLDGGKSDAPTGPVVYVNSCSHVHWTATASASDQGDVAAHAIDGYPTTRWTTGRPQAPSQDYLQIDLGAAVTVSKVVLDNTGGSADDYPRGYSVFLSSDGTTFPNNVVNSIFFNPPGPVVSIPFAPQKAGAVKIVTGGQADVWWSVAEVRFDCQLASPPPAGAIDPYDPVTWKASANFTSPNYPSSNAFDSDPTTRWSSGQNQSGGERFRLDLGAAASVSQMTLDSGGADFPAAYMLEVSADGQAYEQVAAGAGASFTRIQFAQKNARYLRVTQTGMDPNHWWSIAEITIQP